MKNSLANKTAYSGITNYVNDALWGMAKKGALQNLSLLDNLTTDLGELVRRAFRPSPSQPSISHYAALALSVAGIAAYAAPAYAKDSLELMPNDGCSHSMEDNFSTYYTPGIAKYVKSKKIPQNALACPLEKMKPISMKNARKKLGRNKRSASGFFIGKEDCVYFIIDTNKNGAGDVVLYCTDKEYKALIKK